MANTLKGNEDIGTKNRMLRQAEQGDLQNSHLEYFLVDYTVPPKDIREMNLSL